MNLRESAQQATPREQLLKELMDSRVPKTEREHAAAREIERLRADRGVEAVTQDWDEVEALRESLREHMAEIHRLRAALAQQAEPVEPVAWMVYTEGGTSAYVTDNPNDLVGAYRALALYTAPPQRTMVPLTDDEISRIDDATPFHEVADWAVRFARAIERAHGIGGEE